MASPFRSALVLLTQYAEYHRDRRNIATHFVGVPLIVFGVVQALATVWMAAGDYTITLAAVVSIAACIYYFRLDFVFGVTMAVTLFVMCAGASEVVHRLGKGPALGVAAIAFTVGWVIQFVGHYYEGKKPAFVDDLVGLLLGPLFVTAEVGFNLGLRLELKNEIESRVGPTRLRTIGSTGSPTLSK